MLLGLALALGALGLAERLADAPGGGAPAAVGGVLAVAFGPFLVGCFLVANGVTMIRREPLRPMTLLPLLAGLAVFLVIGLDVAAERAGDVPLSLFATVANLVFGYVSFLLRVVRPLRVRVRAARADRRRGLRDRARRGAAARRRGAAAAGQPT